MMKVLFCLVACASALTIKEEGQAPKTGMMQKEQTEVVTVAGVQQKLTDYLETTAGDFTMKQLNYLEHSGIKEITLAVFNDTTVQHATYDFYTKKGASYPMFVAKGLNKALKSDDIMKSLETELFPKGFQDPDLHNVVEAVGAAISRHPEHVTSMRSALVEASEAEGSSEIKWVIQSILFVCFTFLMSPQYGAEMTAVILGAVLANYFVLANNCYMDFGEIKKAMGNLNKIDKILGPGGVFGQQLVDCLKKAAKLNK